jgi:predicted DNA-binding protein with PD1-like motif
MRSIRDFVDSNNLQAVAVVSCAGSLVRACLRFANRDAWTILEGPFEILSLTGTVDAVAEHLHLGLADSDGHCFGGHAGPGCNIFTTAEIIIAELVDLEFRRVPCMLSGYDELTVLPRAAGPDGDDDEI